MLSQRIPFLLSVAILLGAGTTIVALVNAQTETKTFSGSATFQYGDAGGSIENNTLIGQKVIHLRNTGSHPDTFRTTLPVNPETRCGLRGPNGPSPANVLPNTLPITLDMSLAVNETTYISVACVTKDLPIGPFTWSYKTVSVGALDAGVEKVLAEVQDTVQVTEAIPCSDSDGGMDASTKGIATGTYAGARAGYVMIYGQEPNPNSPKTTTDKFSTYIDHCSWDPTHLNEGYCDAEGRLQAMGLRCPNGCKDGVCVAPPSSSSVLSLSSSSASTSGEVPGGLVTPPSGPPSVPVRAGPPSDVPAAPSAPPSGIVHPSAPPKAQPEEQARPAQVKEKRMGREELQRGSSKKLQGIWKIVKAEAYNPETKVFEDHTTDNTVLSGTRYFIFRGNQFCPSPSLPNNNCPAEPFFVKGNIITIGKGEQPPNNSAKITLKGGKLVFLVLPDKAIRFTLKKTKKKEATR